MRNRTVMVSRSWKRIAVDFTFYALQCEMVGRRPRSILVNSMHPLLPQGSFVRCILQTLINECSLNYLPYLMLKIKKSMNGVSEMICNL